MEYKSFFEVCVKCGHVGKGKYVDKIIAVAAKDAKHAAAVARAIPRVKHDHKDAIRYVKEITKEEFYSLKEIQNSDPFFTCKSSYESREKGILKTLDIKEEKPLTITKKIEITSKPLYQGKKKIRNPKKFVKFYPETSYEDYPESY